FSAARTSMEARSVSVIRANANINLFIGSPQRLLDFSTTKDSLSLKVTDRLDVNQIALFPPSLIYDT
ncbi:MAG: hypothetical protein KAS88_02430, partial [Deltaproteobacteria bacterium]|nr:hypothetical protein [Deltaproteobacteria bacterium]